MYDIAVVGLGAMGSSALAAASRAGAKAIGLEQFDRLTGLGGSAGRSRMIRKAYFEDPAYVPLVLAAYDAWEALEARTGAHVFHPTGNLIVGDPSRSIIAGARASAIDHGLAFEELDAGEVRRRYPAITLLDGEAAFYEPDAGYLIPELAIDTMLSEAAAHGAQTRFRARVFGWAALPDGGLRVTLEDGSSIETAKLALCTGAWMRNALANMNVPVRVQRNVQHWFEPLEEGFAEGSFPSFFADRPDHPARLYGFPDSGDGVKAAFHVFGDFVDPDEIDREVHESDVEPVRRALAAFLPGAAGRYLGGKVCMYDLTPDENFVVALHPGDARIAIAGGFSGHGFKFAPVIGEIVAGLALEGGTPYDIGFLSPQRFGGT